MQGRCSRLLELQRRSGMIATLGTSGGTGSRPLARLRTAGSDGSRHHRPLARLRTAASCWKVVRRSAVRTVVPAQPSMCGIRCKPVHTVSLGFDENIQ